MALLLLTSVAIAQAGRDVAPRAALQTMLRELTSEAREAKKSFTLPRTKADYAASFPHAIDANLIATKFLRPVDRDPFIDAYVRWQMTSFLADLPALEDDEFEKFLGELPPCVPNPQVSDAFVQPLMRASEAGELALSDQKHVEKLIAGLSAQREQVGILRRPAEELREWIAGKLGEDGHRPIQASLERCAALAAAGWDLGRIKETITQQCEASFRDRSFTDMQRERVAKQIEALAKPGLLRINNAYLNEGSLIVNADSVGVFDFEIRKWARTIRRQ